MPEAIIVDKSVADNQIGDYVGNPVTILSQSGASVQFHVEQNWIAGDIGWLSVQYTPASGGEDVCHINEALNDEVPTVPYSAKCLNGFASVSLFASDCSFVGIPQAVVPKKCEAWTEGGKTAAFHFLIPCDPVPPRLDVSGCGCQQPVCVPQAKLERKSIGDKVYGDILSNPINIVQFGEKTVKFRVEQNWKEGDLAFLSVQYSPVGSNGSTKECMTTEGVNDFSSTPDYTAQCINGHAIIDVYAYDCTFTGVPGIVQGIPKACMAWKGDGLTTHFQYTLPCSIDDEDFCVDEAACVPVIRTDYKSVASGLGDFNTMPVTILEQTGSTVGFQIDQTWKYEDIGWIAVDYKPAGQVGNSTTCTAYEGLSNGESTPPLKALCVNGVADIDVYAYDCSFTGVPNIDSSVPGTCQPIIDTGKKVHFHFTIPCLCMDELSDFPASTYTLPGAAASASSSNTTPSKPAEATVKATPQVIVAPSEVTCTQPILEDYQKPEQSVSWTDGTEYTDSKLGTFLGRLGVDHSMVSKVFTVQAEAEKVTVTFDFYDVNGKPSNKDVFKLGVQNTYLDLKLFENGKDGKLVNYNDIAVIYTKNTAGTIYSVTATIPQKWYATYNNKLPITFKIESSKKASEIAQDSFGVDNVKIVADCSRRRRVQKKSDATEDKEGFYCSAQDFPCDGGDMVNVCHYSTRKGYETFCIPEADSEILRFYSQDYCGPCIGGFGSGATGQMQ